MLSCKEFPAGEILSKEGEVCNKLYFVNKGVLCSSASDDNGKDLVVHFFLENSISGNWASFFSGLPSETKLQTLESSQCIVITQAALNWFFEHVQEGNTFGIMQYQHLYLWLANRNRLIYLKKPAERYMLLTELYPGIEDRVPQRLLSSFIGIAPSYFSRLSLKK